MKLSAPHSCCSSGNKRSQSTILVGTQNTEVSILRENRKVVFTKIVCSHVLSKCAEERHSPPWNIKLQYVFRGWSETSVCKYSVPRICPVWPCCYFYVGDNGVSEGNVVLIAPRSPDRGDASSEEKSTASDALSKTSHHQTAGGAGRGHASSEENPTRSDAFKLSHYLDEGRSELVMRARWWEMAKIPNHGTIVKEEHWIKKSGAGGHIWRKMMWRISKDALEVLVVASSVITIVVTAVATVQNFLVTQQQTSFILLQCLLLIIEKGTERVWSVMTF